METRSHSGEPVTVLEWTLRLGNDALTCEVTAASEHAFDVSVISWQFEGATITERFSSVLAAMKRHAEIVETLRGQGWKITEYCHPHHVPATAA